MNSTRTQGGLGTPESPQRSLTVPVKPFKHNISHWRGLRSSHQSLLMDFDNPLDLPNSKNQQTDLEHWVWGLPRTFSMTSWLPTWCQVSLASFHWLQERVEDPSKPCHDLWNTAARWKTPLRPMKLHGAHWGNLRTDPRAHQTFKKLPQKDSQTLIVSQRFFDDPPHALVPTDPQEYFQDTFKNLPSSRGPWNPLIRH